MIDKVFDRIPLFKHLLGREEKVSVWKSMVGVTSLIIIIIVASNAMPFYKDGQRMNLFRGIQAITKGAKPTIPFVSPPKGSPCYTQIAPPKRWLKKNPLTDLIRVVGHLVNVGEKTAAFICFLFLWNVYGCFIYITKAPFKHAESRLEKHLKNRELTNKEVRKKFLPAILLAQLIAIGEIVIFELAMPSKIYYTQTGKISFTIPVPNSFEISVMVIMAVIAIINTIKTRQYFSQLISHRCENCNRLFDAENGRCNQC